MSRGQSERSKWSREQAQNFMSHHFLIIIIIIRCSGMFQNVWDVPCSGFYRRPTGLPSEAILGFHVT